MDRLTEIANYFQSERIKCWHLSPKEFNKWRSENDLKGLLAFFLDNLPQFREWMDSFGITDECFLRANHTGRWFLGDTTKKYCEYSHNDEHFFEIIDGTEEIINQFNRSNAKFIKEFIFTPYLLWGTRTFGKKNFICIDKLNKHYAEYPQFNSWSDGLISSANLHNEYKAIKLGQLKLGRNIFWHIGDKNLDFADLDYLEIDCSQTTSSITEINFSSCRSLKIVNQEILAFFLIQNSTIGFSATNSRLQDFDFIDCHFNFHFEKFALSNTSVRGLRIIRPHAFTPHIVNSEIFDFEFEPIKNSNNTNIKECYRKFKDAFISSGQRKEARNCFFHEKNYERKQFWHCEYETYSSRSTRLKPFKISKNLKPKTSFQSIKEVKELMKDFASNILKYYIPKSVHTIKNKTLYTASALNFLIWGYGTKLCHIFLFSLFIIFSFSFLYYFFISHLKDFSNALYFSIVTFTTLGDGNLTPTTILGKFFCALEAILGMILMGLSIGIIANRSNQ